MKLFKEVHNPVDTKSFEKRVDFFKKKYRASNIQ